MDIQAWLYQDNLEKTLEALKKSEEELLAGDLTYEPIGEERKAELRQEIQEELQTKTRR